MTSQAKLRRVGTPAALGAVAILDIILRDEIGHVAIGNRWYRHLCVQRGLDPVSTYAALAARYEAPALKGPFNLIARRAAGFDRTNQPRHIPKKLNTELAGKLADRATAPPTNTH